ncbi:NusA-like transcription termination signal-binding factor [Candidatus Woesearchaeota archaeon]|nr:MAG: NusA-like transcription termination signal-binding factor [Candidatus Woesearchaeota archaeon]
MRKVVLDTKTMQTIALFEKQTRAAIKDCIVTDDQVVFIVEEGEIAKAIGKGGSNVRELERRLRKRIRVIEFSPTLERFVLNVISPLEVKSIRVDGDKVFLDAKDLKTRGLLIGRGASNLRFFESIIKRYYPIEELRVS